MGNIGYYLSGKIPRREKKVALFPFPGWLEEGDWKGFIEEEEKPTLHNPVEGFIVTANNKIIPDNYPNYISIAWLAPFRAERIKELLLQQEKHSIDTLQKIQNDVYSKKGEIFLPYITEMDEPKGELAEAVEILKRWDLHMSSGKGAALYKIFMNHLHEEVLEDELDEDFEQFNDLFKNKQAGILRFFSDLLSPWFDKSETPVKETRGGIIKTSLKKAYEWLREEYGSPDQWDWMKINSISFEHSLGRVPFLKFFNRGPYPIDGDDFTVRPFFTSSAKENWGVSYRQLIDLSNLKNSVCVLSSGESGHFLSRFYDDQIPLWLEGQYHPMLFYRDDIEKEAAGILTLKASRKK
jgi:penicillin amidase